MTRASVAIAATLAAAILWGTSFSVNDYGLRFVGPATFATLRFAIAAAVTLALLAFLRGLDLRLLREPWFWAMCAANASGFLLQYMGQLSTTPARTALFVNTSAFTVALLERAVFRVPLGWRRALAVLFGFAGAAILIVGGDPRDALQGGRLVGDALTLLSGFAWSVYFVLNDRAVERAQPLPLAAWTFAGTALLLLPSLALDPLLTDRAPLEMTLPGALSILYAGTVTTALAFGLWTYGLTRLRASMSAVLLLVEILVASLVSVALGRESFGWVELAGAAVLVGAVVAASVLGDQSKA